VLAAIKQLGVTLIVVEHNLGLVSSVADRVVTMSDGKALAAD